MMFSESFPRTTSGDSQNKNKRIAELERELAECKSALAIERECPPEMKDYALTYRDMELERDALYAQVVQMREALEHAVKHCGCGGVAVLERQALALALDTKPTEQIVAKVKAEALREAAEDMEEGEVWISRVAVSAALRRMADELEGK